MSRDLQEVKALSALLEVKALLALLEVLAYKVSLVVKVMLGLLDHKVS